MSGLPEHLGGQEAGNIDVGLVATLANDLGIQSMVDIGCGDGKATEQYRHLVSRVVGVDGDWTRLPKSPLYILHDFTKGPLAVPADLAYSVEFVEHVAEEYVDNFMPTFAACKYAVITAARPGQRGHHHVNCQPPEYWIEQFRRYGMVFDPDYTEHLKKVSTMQKARGPRKGKRVRFFDRTGMFFRRQ